MKKIILTSFLVLSLAGCGADSFLAKAQPSIASVCNTAMGLSAIAGPYAAWIIAGCGSEAAIARLALDPSSVEWVEGIVSKVRSLRS